MKNLLKLPVLLLAMMLVVSCGGDSKKEEEKKLSPVEQAAADGERAGCAWECEMEAAKKADDRTTGEKLFNERDALEAKYGEKGSASDEEKEAFMKAVKTAMGECSC